MNEPATEPCVTFRTCKSRSSILLRMRIGDSKETRTKKTSLGHSEKCKGHAARIALIQRPPRIICSGFFRKLRLTLSRMPYFPSEFLRRESIPLADLSANFASEVCMIRTFQLLQKMSASKNLSLDIECPPPAKKNLAERKPKCEGRKETRIIFADP